ncbi:MULTISPECIES: single-stranded DNA-binding protein [Nocardioides]|uniref:Single-stranded DNA-binding protein n=1 Tax=Nocardioides vastitatis TaxID=2568655 RepID=A0ABW0ZMZ2_9ACTN|nr:single-stranded DNA-binding protein [Nocardioides sp.]THI96323.1 single-stranded DNA-binding protein [Nocardioides sp.]
MAKAVRDVTVNEVRLVGTLSAGPQVRELPSGDALCVCRLVVPRTDVRVLPSGRRGPSVDVVDLAAWAPRPRRSMAGWQAGDEVEVAGALRRRFYRSGGRTASRVEVEIRSGRVVRRAGSG